MGSRCMVRCVAYPHACLASVLKFRLQTRPVYYYYHFAKNTRLRNDSLRFGAASAHNWRLSYPSMLLPCNKVRILPYKVANFRSTFPFCCGVPGALSSKLIPKPSFSHARCWARFSPALSQRTIFTTISYLHFRSLIREMILSEVSLFFLRK